MQVFYVVGIKIFCLNYALYKYKQGCYVEYKSIWQYELATNGSTSRGVAQFFQLIQQDYKQWIYKYQTAKQ